VLRHPIPNTIHSIEELSMNSNTEKIKERAYDLFLNRNGNGGTELEDWLKAEKEIEPQSAWPMRENNASTNKAVSPAMRQSVLKKGF
jgi:hypothetical protein